jgi:Xaa-Pro aminopeptidase
MRSISKEKYELLVKFLQENDINALLVSDFEDCPNINFRYLSGQPSDGLILVLNNGESHLIPWDLSIAEKYAEVDEIYDIANYKYNFFNIVKEIISNKFGTSEIIVGIGTNFPYGSLVKMETLIPNIRFFKEPQKIGTTLGELRATKSEFELKQLRKATEIGNKTIKDIKKFAENAAEQTENDLSFLVRRKIAEYGGDDIAFDSLVANASRAHELHCYPPASNQKFALQGLALIDFGANYQGYHSDITVPFAFGKLTEEQEKFIEIVLKSYEGAVEMVDIGVPLWKVHSYVEETLKKEGFNMPYALGHGLGLSEHDSPFISRKPTDEYGLKYWKEIKFEDGMVFTIEPGVYKQGLGGCRIENDLMIHNGKVEVLTQSELIRIH